MTTLKLSYSWLTKRSLATCGRPALDTALDSNPADLFKLLKSINWQNGIDQLREETIESYNADASKQGDAVVSTYDITCDANCPSACSGECRAISQQQALECFKRNHGYCKTPDGMILSAVMVRPEAKTATKEWPTC